MDKGMKVSENSKKIEMREYINQKIKALDKCDEATIEKAYLEMGELLSNTYGVDDLPLHQNEYFILANYYRNKGNDNAELAMTGAAFVNNLSSFSEHGEYFAVLDLINICVILLDNRHIHSAKMILKVIENWTEEEFTDSKHYEILKLSINELRRILNEMAKK